MPGLVTDRADIIVAGLAVVDRIMARFKVNLLQVHNRGVRDGLLLTMIDESLAKTSADDPSSANGDRAFCGGLFGRIAHGRHVAKLAGSIFAQLAEPFRMDPADRWLVETAARLQDVGYLINYDQHHKHSYHLIMNSNLPGFRPKELELVANVARYHRAHRPSRSMTISASFPRKISGARQLAAILRIAGGLDRSHTQQVSDVSLRLTQDSDDHSVSEVCCWPTRRENPEVDLWGSTPRRNVRRHL